MLNCKGNHQHSSAVITYIFCHSVLASSGSNCKGDFLLSPLLHSAWTGEVFLKDGTGAWMDENSNGCNSDGLCSEIGDSMVMEMI